MSPLLWRSVLRHLARHPWQLGLSILGIALGVAVVLAVDLANASARKGFELSMEQVTGRATHRIAGGPQEVPEAVYVRLRLELGLRDTAPVVSGYVALAGSQAGCCGCSGWICSRKRRFEPISATSATAASI